MAVINLLLARTTLPPHGRCGPRLLADADYSFDARHAALSREVVERRIRDYREVLLQPR
ncbi:hypothetical protein AB9K41_03680 [Cribrihabitans sp. XS_ASV171]